MRLSKKRTTLALLVACSLLLPAMVRAQGVGETSHPDDYTQEDSHPVKVIYYLLSPVGFLLEWGITRPIHYIAAKSPLAPVFAPGDDAFGDLDAPRQVVVPPDIPVPPPPPNSYRQGGPYAQSSMPPSEFYAGPANRSSTQSQSTQSQGTQPQGTQPQSTLPQPPVIPYNSSSQPILH